MAAARSRGKTASAWSGVRVPERNAATRVGSRTRNRASCPQFSTTRRKAQGQFRRLKSYLQTSLRPLESIKAVFPCSFHSTWIVGWSLSKRKLICGRQRFAGLVKFGFCLPETNHFLQVEQVRSHGFRRA